MFLGGTRVKHFNKSEFILGFLSTAILITRLHWTGLALSILTSFLWALSGAGFVPKAIRRYGVPIAAFAAVVYALHFHWWYLLMLDGIAVLHLGDSYPDFRPSTRDEGSWLGKVVYATGLSDELGGLVTKLIVVLILQLAWIPAIW